MCGEKLIWCGVESVYMHMNLDVVKKDDDDQKWEETPPKTIYIDDKEPPLSKMQELVGGYIEIISPNPKLQIIANEEGLLMNLPINKEATLVWKNSGNYIENAIIVGDAIILTKKGLIRG